ncbi:caspase recruitment domain-containing protein 8-like [Aquarana catesbeiana]|uniref:caspase recruitment domain-containing protein 8-like n=1 Tax=Aquarana catesbeiana TaxID=8400 RepID=UPI003CC9D96C
MKQIKDSGYELVGFLFNITVEPSVVSSVHLPHYLHLEGLGKDKSSIKYGHFKDGKLHFKSPTSINSSYIVLDNPTFSRAGAMFRLTSFWTQRKKSISISGMVLLYFCVVSPHLEKVKEYRTHLYLVPCKKADLKELDKRKTKNGFQMIDKPPGAKLIAGKTYTVTHTVTHEKTDDKVKPLFLEFEIKEEIQNLNFLEINVKGNAKSIFLLAAAEDQDTTVWSGELTEDLEHQSAKMLRRFKETDMLQLLL